MSSVVRSSVVRRAFRVGWVTFACHGVLVLLVECADYLTNSNPVHLLAYHVEHTLDRPIFEFVHQDWVTFWMRGPMTWLFGPSAWGWGPLVQSISALGFVLFGGLLYAVPAFFLAFLWGRWQTRRSAPTPVLL